MKKDRAQYIIKIGAVLFFAGIFIFYIVRMIYETEMLKGPTVKIPAFLMKIQDSSSKNTKKALVIYSVKGRNYDFYSEYDYLDMEVGDTVLIEYSVKDPGVARVVEKYYMQKYKHLKK